jgi:4a-hydroxytetrahydrobiopterin dehydratase
MPETARDPLISKRCVPCEGGVPTLTPDEVASLMPQVPYWSVTTDGKRIRREWVAKNFVAAVRFFDKVAELAEAEGHHPDLHLEGYRNVAVEVWTHAIGGLSENDFILAAKIDEVPFDVKKPKGNPA